MERNPVHSKGDRNAFCPHYATCLDDAVKKSWAYWDCAQCDYRNTKDPKMEVHSWESDSMPYYNVSDDIFDKL